MEKHSYLLTKLDKETLHFTRNVIAIFEILLCRYGNSIQERSLPKKGKRA